MMFITSILLLVVVNAAPPSYAYETECSQYPSKKEDILADIRRKGLDATLDHYLQFLDHPAGKDSTLSADLLEVALQLVKNLWHC